MMVCESDKLGLQYIWSLVFMPNYESTKLLNKMVKIFLPQQSIKLTTIKKYKYENF